MLDTKCGTSYVNGPLVLPSDTRLDRSEMQELLRFWQHLLDDPKLLERSIFFNRAAYEDLRVPEVKRHRFTKKVSLDFSNADNWERVTEDYAVAIPVGGKRRVGMEMCFTDPLLSVVLEELEKSPADFPSLRHMPSEFGRGEDIWWGEDISATWALVRTRDVHREIGRAFGYREDRILQAYPNPWWRRLGRRLGFG